MKWQTGSKMIRKSFASSLVCRFFELTKSLRTGQNALMTNNVGNFMKLRLLTCLFLVGLSACSSLSRQSDSLILATTDDEIEKQVSPPPSPTGLHQPGDKGGKVEIMGVLVDPARFDIPFRANNQVERWIEYFTDRGRKHFEVYLKRSQYFIPYLQEILKANQMPADLVYLAMIESGFNNHAKSKAKAVGTWQFIRGTALRYGLSVNWWVDERRDIRKSTVAAIGYLKDLYNIFGAWELAAASYNAGEAKVARAIERFVTRDFWALSRTRYLSAETRNYVPKMIAAAVIGKYRKEFGFPEHYDDPLPEVEEEMPIPLPNVLAENEDEEPENMTPENGTAPLADNSDVEEAKTNDEEDENRIDPSATQTFMQEITKNKGALTPHVNRKGELDASHLVEIEVTSPADLLSVAKAAGISYDRIKNLNPEVLRWCTPPSAENYKLKIPVSNRERFLVTYNHPSFERDIKFRLHRAQPGDTLNKIARRYGVNVDSIRDLNRFGKDQPLPRGVDVKLPMPSDPNRSVAALDLKDYETPRKSKRGRGKVSSQSRKSARSVQ
jgi:hypothetical protein